MISSVLKSRLSDGLRCGELLDPVGIISAAAASCRVLPRLRSKEKFHKNTDPSIKPVFDQIPRIPRRNQGRRNPELYHVMVEIGVSVAGQKGKG